MIFVHAEDRWVICFLLFTYVIFLITYVIFLISLFNYFCCIYFIWDPCLYISLYILWKPAIKTIIYIYIIGYAWIYGTLVFLFPWATWLRQKGLYLPPTCWGESRFIVIFGHLATNFSVIWIQMEAISFLKMYGYISNFRLEWTFDSKSGCFKKRTDFSSQWPFPLIGLPRDQMFMQNTRLVRVCVCVWFGDQSNRKHDTQWCMAVTIDMYLPHIHRTYIHYTRMQGLLTQNHRSWTPPLAISFPILCLENR